MLATTQTRDMRIVETTPLRTPQEIINQCPLTEAAAATTMRGRQEVVDVMRGNDNRLVVIVGPCSIHDQQAAMEYAERLAVLRKRYGEKLVILMRTYFEKPRTRLGWTGLLPQPYLDESYDFDSGRLLARQLLVAINELGVPAATEYLNASTPQYIGDIIAWAAIGARTTEAPGYRHLVSGVSCPVGFKNGTDGNVNIATDAMVAAAHPHSFLGICLESGRECMFTSSGNPDTQLILRGGATPNYERATVAAANEQLVQNGLCPRVIVDCSHGNSRKDYRQQGGVLEYILRARRQGGYLVSGVMLESFLVAGNQKIGPPESITYGQSVTDGCIGIEETESLLARAYELL